MSQAASDSDFKPYYVPHEGSIWPIVGIVGMVMIVMGAASMMNHGGFSLMFWLGMAVVIYMFFKWFGDVIRESMGGLYSKQMDMTFRMGMAWFIFSEVMFFAAFFGALYYARTLSIPWLAGEGGQFATNLYLWPGFEATWPTSGPAELGGAYKAMAPWGEGFWDSLPLINTLILLTSGVTLTWAHHGIFKHNQTQVVAGLAMTVALGAIFLFLQAEEYIHAYSDEMNLTLGTGIYGSTFFMLTGFHGMHVTLGTIMLIVALVRAMRGHYTPENHFSFEGIAWYWHFVDVVWLGLFIFVYII